MYTYDDGSCVVYVPTIAAMVLATPDSTEYDRTEANGILLKMLKQRHPVRKFYDGRSYEDFRDSEVEFAESDLALIRRHVMEYFLPQMKKMGYSSYVIEDECSNPIWESEYDSDLEWGKMWSVLREIENYTTDYLNGDSEVVNGMFSESFPNPETALFYTSCAHIMPKEKHSLYCIPVRFRS